MSWLRPARIAAVVVAGALALAACTPAAEEPSPEEPTTDEATPDPELMPRSDVGVQLFQFTWDSIATQCTDVLGPAGYDWVLTSPPQEHIAGAEWWTSYQVASYRVESRLGTREQFSAMVDACHEAGVRVIADAVVNHMTGLEEGTGWAGSEFTHYDYPGIYGYEDFHHCDLTPGDDIASYQDAEQVQTCELLNLADLDTSSEYVQGTIRAYLADLVTLGVDGFRIDAAKHMAPGDIGGFLAGLPSTSWIVQEVIRAPGEPITPEDYLGNGAVFEFSYMRNIPGVVRGTSWSRYLAMGEGSGYAPSDLAVPFVTNHDTERNGQSLSYKDGSEYQFATVLMILQGYGSPMVYSGYSFSDRDAGPPLTAEGTVADAVCIEGWEPAADGEFVCAHTWPMVNAAVRFDAVGGAAELEVTHEEGDVLGIRRGDAFAVVNRGEEPVRVTAQTGLPAGEYCELVNDRECSAPVIVDDDGEAAFELGSLGAAVLTAEDVPGESPVR